MALRLCSTISATVVILAFAASGALAADMPLKAPPPMAPTAFSWAGPYVGLNAGAAWGLSDPQMTASNGAYLVPGDVALFNANGSPRFRPDAFTGGAQVGYNWQSQNIVWGIEADFESFRLRAANAVTVPYIPAFAPNTFTLNQAVSTDWLATVRPRVGWANNNWLIYGTGGLAVTRLSYSGTFTDTFGAAEAGSFSKIVPGWAAGAGAEWAFANNWSAKIEYLFVDFGRTTTGVGTENVFQPISHSANLKADILRVALDYQL